VLADGDVAFLVCERLGRGSPQGLGHTWPLFITFRYQPHSPILCLDAIQFNQ